MADEHFGAVIIGSGFGGSVMAYRLAEAGVKVCLLERGQAYPPYSFPRAPHKLKRNFWDPSGGLYGMFNIWSFKGFGALVSSGLGGGSLIYANVLLRKDEKWFVRENVLDGGYEYWPVTRAELDPHYDRVEKMMNAQLYPFQHSPYDRAGKTAAMKYAADRRGLNWQLLPLAVSFRRKSVEPGNPDDPNNAAVVGEPIQEARPNYHGRTRSTCVLCGECDIGCNTGSKNTLDYNYITEAKHCGAEIRTLSEVRGFDRRSGGGFTVDYVRHDLSLEGSKTDTSQLPLTSITCDRLILSAGVFGTPFLLLKNRAAVPRISKMLGTRFNVNGDLLSFIARSKEDAHGVKVPRGIDPSFGPVITSAIRVGDSEDGEEGRGFYVEDGGQPQFMTWLLDAALDAPGFVDRFFAFGKRAIWGYLGLNPDGDWSREISELLGKSDRSLSSFPVLSMGRDVPNGNMRLRGQYLDVDWKVDESQFYYDRVTSIVKDIAKTLDAKYVPNLPYEFLRLVLTTHPLGGSPMGRSKDEGVVDSYGQVFDYPGLYIADGSVMPGPVGANPALTIAALSNRFAQHIIDTKGA
jgi:cholesterol oxidase